MRPVVWWPPVEPSAAEQAVIKAVLRARLFVFLRLHRHELFDERFQAELAEAYVDSPKGQPPVPPAQRPKRPACTRLKPRRLFRLGLRTNVKGMAPKVP